MDINLTNLSGVRPLKTNPADPQQRLADAREVQETFRQFVGESFYGQPLKSMRSVQGEPAYFHGGRAEEAFQGQLDQTLSEKMTEASADQIADPMFRHQFPAQAEVIAEAEAASTPSTADLLSLRRQR